MRDRSRFLKKVRVFLCILYSMYIILFSIEKFPFNTVLIYAAAQSIELRCKEDFIRNCEEIIEQIFYSYEERNAGKIKKTSDLNNVYRKYGKDNVSFVIGLYQEKYISYRIGYAKTLFLIWIVPIFFIFYAKNILYFFIPYSYFKRRYIKPNN